MTDFYTLGFEDDFEEGNGVRVVSGALDDLAQINRIAENLAPVLTLVRAERPDKTLTVYKVTPFAHIFAEDVTRENAFEGDTVALRLLDEQDAEADRAAVENFDVKGQ